MPVRSIRHKFALGAFAAATTLGLGTLVASPALAGVSSAYATASPTYSYAEIYVNNGTQGEAWARHGSAYADSGWWTYYAWARASGSSTSRYGAGYNWR